MCYNVALTGGSMNLHDIQSLPEAQNYSEMVADLFKKDLGGESAARMHAAIGVAGEAGELLMAHTTDDLENFIEEAGDSLFYVQALMNTNNWTLEELTPSSVELFPDYQEAAIAGVIYESCNMLDIAKKSWVYNKEFDAGKMKEHLIKYLAYLEISLDGYQLTIQDCFNHNQYKLVTGPKARYPSGKYTDSAAIARADKMH